MYIGGTAGTNNYGTFAKTHNFATNSSIFDATVNGTRLDFTVNSAASMVLTSTGLGIGIGAGSPSFKLVVKTATDGDTAAFFYKDFGGAESSNSSNLLISPSVTAGQYSGITQARDAAIVYSTSTTYGGLFIGPNNGQNQGLRLDKNSEMYVSGSITAGTTLTASTGVITVKNFNASTSESGVIRFGTGADHYFLYSAETPTLFGAVGYYLAKGDMYFGFGGTYNLSVTGDVIAYSASDQRLKTNIKPITNAVDKINKLDGITYNWNELARDRDTTLTEAGLLAQQVEAVLPEVVTTREDGYMAVKYERIVPLLVEAIKELSAEVKELKKQLAKI